MVDRERRVLRVIESRLQPVGRVVTSLAGSGEKLRLCRMSRIGRRVVIRLVTTHASGGERCVVVVDVTIGAEPRRNRMHAGQWERGVVVIKDAVRP